MVAADRGDKYRGNILRQQRAHLLLQLLVNHIALGDRQQSLLVQEFGVVLRELAQQNIVILLNIIAIGRNHKQQHRISLDVAQEACADTLALVCALDNSGNIRHNERLMVASLDNAQIRLQSSKCVVCNLGFGCRNNRQQGTLAGIGEAYKTYICQDLQFEDECALSTLLTRLCIAWSLVCGGLEVPVAQTSATTLQQYELLALLGDLADNLGVGLARLLIGEYLLGNRSEGYGDNDILGILTR